METFNAISDTLTKNPLGAVAAGEAVAIVFLARELLKSQAAHLATALSIGPIGAKLAEGVEAIARILSNLPRGRE